MNNLVREHYYAIVATLQVVAVIAGLVTATAMVIIAKNISKLTKDK